MKFWWKSRLNFQKFKNWNYDLGYGRLKKLQDQHEGKFEEKEGEFGRTWRWSKTLKLLVDSEKASQLGNIRKARHFRDVWCVVLSPFKIRDLFSEKDKHWKLKYCNVHRKISP